MSRPDDSSLTPEQFIRVRAEAERALRESGVLGCIPTPISEVMRVAQVEEVEDDVLNESFVDNLRRKAGQGLKRALTKVIGLFDAVARLIFIDRALYVVKQSFVRLHETGHAFMMWQRDLYAIVEDCEQTIDPELADLFDREANVFASEVLFQLDTFQQEAEQRDFSILTPVNLSRKFGASVYASIRQYVTKNHRACAVLVLNKPELCERAGIRATLRRGCCSPRFLEIFGRVSWPEVYTPDDQFGAIIPLPPRRMSKMRKVRLRDLNGDEHVCLAEAFTQTIQVFILIHATGTLKQPSVFLR